MKNDLSTGKILSVNATCRQANASTSFPAFPMQAGLDSSLFSITSPLTSSPSLRNPCSEAAWATLLTYQGLCLAWFHAYGFHFPCLLCISQQSFIWLWAMHWEMTDPCWWEYCSHVCSSCPGWSVMHLQNQLKRNQRLGKYKEKRDSTCVGCAN